MYVKVKTIHPEKGSKLEDAVWYSLNQKQQLMAFLDYGDVTISINLAENAIYPFVVDRMSRLFCDSVKDVKSRAIVYSHGIELNEYLMVVLSMRLIWENPQPMRN